MNNYYFVFFVFILSLFPTAYAQNDTLVTKSGTTIIGEIKGMNKGVLNIETDYSDSDFAIDWDELQLINSDREFIISVIGGTIYNGQIQSPSNNKVEVFNKNKQVTTIALENIVQLRTFEKSFKDKFDASLSLGYNFTKSSNFSQFSLRSSLTYRARKWKLEGNYNGINSTRDDVEAIRRINASVGYRYYLQNDWYPLAEVNILSNTEQNIELRTVTRLGFGKYIKRTNDMYWGIQAGTSYNNESFTDPETTSQNSMEGFLGTQLNLYDIGDLNLVTSIIAYPGITEGGRFRLDGNIDLKYDLPLDFFVNFGFTLNYDNEPILNENEYDYIFQTSIGWDF